MPDPATDTASDRVWWWTSVITLVALACASPFIARAAFAVLAVESTTPLDWVPASFPPRREYSDFVRRFESGDVVVVSWPGCVVDAPEIARLAAAVTGGDAPRDAAGRPWFGAPASGTDALAKLTDPPLALPRAEAVARLRGVIVGDDGRTTCVVIPFTPEGVAARRQAVAWIRARALAAAGVPEADLHLAGPVVDNVVVDEASNDSLRQFGLPAAVVIFFIAWRSLRSIGYAVLVFLLSAWCVGLAFFALEACGDRMNPVLIVMPVLVLVLGTSGGIHLVNYLYESLEQGGAAGVASRAVRLAWQPCALSAGTTAIGLASLVVSELEPIRAFGLHAAIGVMAALAVTFLVVPGIFARFPPPPRPPTGRFSWAPFAAVVVRWSGPLVILFGLAMVLAGAGVPWLRTSVRIDTLFSAESRVIRDYAWIEREIGPLVPIEVVLTFAPGHGVRSWERVDLVRAVEDRLRRMDDVAAVSSPAGFLPAMKPGGFGGAARKVIASRRLEQSLSAVEEMRIVLDEPEGQLWRVTARVPALRDVDYGAMLDRVRRAITPLVSEAGGADRGIAATYTGVMPLIHGIQNTLLGDLFTSFVSACGLIAVVMMIVEGGIGAGLLAMASNVFPMILLFGILGWTRMPLDIGSVMTASIALGMAIDGTLHFLTFFRRARDAGAEPAAAVHAAFDHAASALTQGTLVSGLGILVFAASSFAPASRFGIMLALLMLAALAGDLVFLPALLVRPRLGRLIPPRRQPMP